MGLSMTQQLHILREPDDCSLDSIKGRTISLIGYGNQGRAHALNIRDSGIKLLVGAREGPGAEQARRDGMDVCSIEHAAATGDLVILGLPDEVHGTAWNQAISGAIRPGTVIGVMHGFSIHYGLLDPPEQVGVVMVAPKGPGHTLRQRYVEGDGIPCLFAVPREIEGGLARSLGLGWATAIGCARSGVIETTAGDETETDLFGEQAVLCGGVMALILEGFKTLVDAGYPPELAYIECCHEVKQVVDLVYAGGLAKMLEMISNTAEFGAHVGNEKLRNSGLSQHMQALLKDVQDGDFARRYIEDIQQGGQWFSSRRRSATDEEIEEAGRRVRQLMPWLAATTGDQPGDRKRP